MDCSHPRAPNRVTLPAVFMTPFLCDLEPEPEPETELDPFHGTIIPRWTDPNPEPDPEPEHYCICGTMRGSTGGAPDFSSWSCPDCSASPWLRATHLAIRTKAFDDLRDLVHARRINPTRRCSRLDAINMCRRNSIGNPSREAPAIVLAVCIWDLPLVSDLLELRADPNTADARGTRALAWACGAACWRHAPDISTTMKLSVIDKLLEYGASPDCNESRETPLHKLMDGDYDCPVERCARFEITASLVKAKADVNLLDFWGLTPLHLLAMSTFPGRHGSKTYPLRAEAALDTARIAKLLLDHGADVNAYSTDQHDLSRRRGEFATPMPPLVMLCLAPAYPHVTPGSLGLVKVLVAYGAERSYLWRNFQGLPTAGIRRSLLGPRAENGILDGLRDSLYSSYSTGYPDGALTDAHEYYTDPERTSESELESDEEEEELESDSEEGDDTGLNSWCRVEVLAARRTLRWVGKLERWLERTEHWISPLHHLRTISAAKAREELRSGADIRCIDKDACSPDVDADDEGHLFVYNAVDPDTLPSPLSLAHEEEAAGRALAGSAASMVLLAAGRWSSQAHDLFPYSVRTQATELVRIGFQLSRQPRFAGSTQAAMDLWVSIIMPHVVIVPHYATE